MCCMHVSRTHPAADPSFDAALCVTPLVFRLSRHLSVGLLSGMRCGLMVAVPVPLRAAARQMLQHLAPERLLKLFGVFLLDTVVVRE